MKKIIELYKKYEEIINYIFVGGCTTLVSLGSYYLCVFTVFNPDNAILLQAATIISWVLAVILHSLLIKFLCLKARVLKY